MSIQFEDESQTIVECHKFLACHVQQWGDSRAFVTNSVFSAYSTSDVCVGRPLGPVIQPTLTRSSNVGVSSSSVLTANQRCP